MSKALMLLASTGLLAAALSDPRHASQIVDRSVDPGLSEKEKMEYLYGPAINQDGVQLARNPAYQKPLATFRECNVVKTDNSRKAKLKAKHGKKLPKRLRPQ